MTIDALTLRPATPADLGAVDALLSAKFPRLLSADYPPSVMVTAVPRLMRANPRLLASGTFYLAEAEGRVVGAGGWLPVGPRGTAAEVRQVAVDWRLPRRGIGRSLMARIEADLTALGITRLDALATRTAVPFYRAMGFIGRTEVEIPLAPGIVFPAVAMVRRF